MRMHSPSFQKQSSEKLKQQHTRSNTQISIYHNYNQQKLNYDTDSSLSIQPLSKLLNLNLNSPINNNNNNNNNIEVVIKQNNVYQSPNLTTSKDLFSNKNLIQNNITNPKLSQSNQFMKKNFQNGLYYGQMNTHSPNGEGGFFWDSGCFYYGQWRDGLMHGCGLFIFKTGSVLRGNFKKGMANGLAELSFFCQFQQQILNGFWNEGQYQGNSPAQFYQNGLTSSNEQGIQKLIEQEQQNTEPFYVKTQAENNLQSKDFQMNQNSSSFQVNPYYYDNELKKKLMNYTVCENSIEVGERKNNLLNGLAIKFHFDGKIEFGSFKKGLLEGRAKILFKGGDMYDGYFINSVFQGPGVYYNNSEKVWAYGAFSKNKIMYLQQQNNTYPPPALYDLRQKDDNIDLSDRLIGENQMRDRNIIPDHILIESLQNKANGEQTNLTQQSFQDLQTMQSHQLDDEPIILLNQQQQQQQQQLINSQFKFQNNVNQSPTTTTVNNTISISDGKNYGGLRKTADFGNTIKNLSQLFQQPINQEIEYLEEIVSNEFNGEDSSKSIQEQLLEKQLELDDGNSQKHTINLQSHTTHQTINGITPRSQFNLSARHITSINNSNCPQSTYYPSDQLEYPKESSTSHYYGISDETYQIIKELEQQEIISKKREKSSEKITKIKALISNYLTNPVLTNGISGNNNNNKQQINGNNNTNTNTNKINKENMNPIIGKRTPSKIIGSYSTRNVFSTSNQNSQNKTSNRDSFNKQKINKQSSNLNSCINIINNSNKNQNNNILSQQNNIFINQNNNNNNNNVNNNNVNNINGYSSNQSKSPLRQMELKEHIKNNVFKKQQSLCFQNNSDKIHQAVQPFQINNQKQQQQQQQFKYPNNNNQQQQLHQQNKPLLRAKNQSLQIEPYNSIKNIADMLTKQKTPNTINATPQSQQGNNNNIYKCQIESNAISTPNKIINHNNPSTTSHARINSQVNDFAQHFFFTQSCRNHKRNASSINFSTSNISQNLMKQKIQSSQLKQNKQTTPLKIQIY